MSTKAHYGEAGADNNSLWFECVHHGLVNGLMIEKHTGGGLRVHLSNAPPRPQRHDAVNDLERRADGLVPSSFGANCPM
mgnify:CR=1 FL=1